MQLIKGKFKTDFVDAKKFKKDLLKCYISRFFIEELRNFYTEKERISFLKKQNPNKQIKGCTTGSSSLCHQMLYDYSIIPEQQKFYIFKQRGVLSNLKFYHFHKNDTRSRNIIDKNKCMRIMREPLDSIKKKVNYGQDRMSEASPLYMDLCSKVIEEVDSDELLIERQGHACTFKIFPEQKKEKLERARENFLRDYRLIHSGLIDVALSKLKESRPREVDKIRTTFDYNPIGGKYNDADDADLDFLFDGDDMQEEGITADPSLGPRKTRIKRETNFTGGGGDKSYRNDDSRVTYQMPYNNGSSDEQSDSNDDIERPDNGDEANPSYKRPSPVKRKDSGGGLFGIAEWDSDEEDLPVQKAFSFIDTNLDKFNVLNFIENQESKVAPN